MDQDGLGQGSEAESVQLFLALIKSFSPTKLLLSKQNTLDGCYLHCSRWTMTLEPYFEPARIIFFLTGSTGGVM